MSEAYRIDFEDLESEFVQLFIEVTKIIEKAETVTTEKLKHFLSRFRDLRASLASADTIIDLLDIIQDHSSFTCCSLLNMLLDISRSQQQPKKSKVTSNLWSSFAHKN